MIGMGYVFITNENVGAIPAGARVRISSATQDASDWIYLIVTQDEQTTAEARASQLAWAAGVTPGPTPTSPFDSGAWSDYTLMTLVDIGPIPANTWVRISSGWFNGVEWRYTIVAPDAVTTAEAGASQLTYRPGYVTNPTPTAMFGNAIGQTGASVTTTQAIGSIPAFATVHISSAWYNGVEWTYTVYADNGATADARESQLSFLSWQATPVSQFSNLIGTFQTVMTTDIVGSIPPNTRVTIISAYFNGTEWMYQIVTQDGVTATQVRDAQLAIAPPEATATPLVGSALNLTASGNCTSDGAVFVVTNNGSTMTAPQHFDVTNLDNLTDSQASGTVQLASGQSQTITVTTTVRRLLMVVTSDVPNSFGATARLECATQ